MKKKVLVTGIGGNVGQGILRNILAYYSDIELIGTDVVAISAGNHLCEKVYVIPFSTDKRYISEIKKICTKEQIDLIIPSTDYEVYFLSLHKDSLPMVACSDSDFAGVCLNKHQTWINFNKYKIPFAETVLPSDYESEFKKIIVKPAEGRGSRDLFINPSSVKSFSDEFIVQKYYKGKEITTGFYVTKQGKFLGQITFKRSLTNGATSQCEVVRDYDKEIEVIIKRIMSHFIVKGSCNIQSIVTPKGKIIPFEINCRISGTNSIRSHFGFKDVCYTIDEYLFNKIPKKPVIISGSAIRILMDVIYPGEKISEIENKSTKHIIF